MASRVKRHLSTLKLIRKASPSFQKVILKNSNSDFVKCLCEVCINVLNGNINLKKDEKLKLKKHKKLLRYLSNRKKSLSLKKDRLVQSGSGFLIPLLAPLVGGLVSFLFRK